MRSDKIDLLRFLGLMMIILAHVGAPTWLFQLRNFDVPLMVIVSGMGFARSSRKTGYADYALQRFRRLVLPVWIFLTFYFFSADWLFAVKFAPDTVIQSYFLFGGIGYVWVIRIFLLIAIVGPLLSDKLKRVESNGRFLLICLAALVCVEVIDSVLSMLGRTGRPDSLEDVGMGACLYLIVFLFGARLESMSRKQLFSILAGSVLIFVSIFATLYLMEGRVIVTQDYKYPPRLYYLSYAVVVSMFFWLVSAGMVRALCGARIFGVVRFVSKNSIWVYLWHIFFLNVWSLPFYSKYFVVLVAAILIAWIQVTLIQHLLEWKWIHPRFGNLIKTVLTG